jgi:hypothetical protein
MELVKSGSLNIHSAGDICWNNCSTLTTAIPEGISLIWRSSERYEDMFMHPSTNHSTVRSIYLSISPSLTTLVCNLPSLIDAWK